MDLECASWSPLERRKKTRAARCRLSAALNFFYDFHFFSAIFTSWIIRVIRNASHRRLEIKKVSEQGGSDPPRSTRHTHFENCHHWRRPSCNEINMQQWCHFQEPVRLLIAIAHSVYSFMVTIFSHMNLNFLKIYLPLNVSIKRIGSVPKISFLLGILCLMFCVCFVICKVVSGLILWFLANFVVWWLVWRVNE